MNCSSFPLGMNSSELTPVASYSFSVWEIAGWEKAGIFSPNSAFCDKDKAEQLFLKSPKWQRRLGPNTGDCLPGREQASLSTQRKCTTGVLLLHAFQPHGKGRARCIGNREQEKPLLPYGASGNPAQHQGSPSGLHRSAIDPTSPDCPMERIS